jgi:2-hydroxychromene-2-carboxylate isomerase
MNLAVTLYIDYRSPFSYLVTDDARALARDLPIDLKWQPFQIDLEGAYGGQVEERSERDWRKIRYLYMDARRLANRRGKRVLGPQKIFDPTIAHIGMLLSLERSAEVFERYHDAVGFWSRELDIEDLEHMCSIAAGAGVEAAEFDEAVISGEGRARCRTIVEEAEADGVFGVPTFLIGATGELFWGTDRVWMLRERLGELLRQQNIDGPVAF